MATAVAEASPVGPRVRALREGMGLSLRDLAERSGEKVLVGTITNNLPVQQFSDIALIWRGKAFKLDDLPVGVQKSFSFSANDASIQEIHLRRAEKACNETGDGALEEIERSALLLDQSVAHENDAVRKCHGLDLVVCHVDHRLTKLLMEALDFAPHLVAQLRIKIGQRLIKQE